MLSSLSNRIFLASALLAVLSIGTALFLVNLIVTRQAELELEESLNEAGELVTQFQSLLFNALRREAELVADLPKLKAAVATRHAPTVAPLADEFRAALEADVLIVTDRDGVVLAAIGDAGLTPQEMAAHPIIEAARAGRSPVDVWSDRAGLLQVVSVPIFIDPLQPEILGTLTAGLRLDRPLADRIKAITRSDVVFVDRGEARGSTLPPAVTRALLAVADDGGTLRATVDGEEYEAVRRRLVVSVSGAAASDGAAYANRPAPQAIVAQSRTAHLAFLSNLHSLLGATTAVAVLVATLLSFAVARSVTRPIRALTATMREMATTGVLRPTPPPAPPTPWEDEDARLLTGTFHTLTGSLERFQREAAQRERLSSLGRLSTVIAHEIRNPLMIIKGSVRSLRRGTPTPDEVASLAADIEGEVARLNRVVNDVLDYAKPIAFTYDAVEIDRLVRDAAQAVLASQGGEPDVIVETATGVTATTDADRLRQVVINLVTNARDAVLARRPEAEAVAVGPGSAAEPAPLPPVTVRAQLAGDDHVEIVVADRGIGMTDVEAARIFEPFFTTKKGGSGIGLAIARNVVDGLGGRIDIESRPGAGTTIRLTLPRTRPA